MRILPRNSERRALVSAHLFARPWGAEVPLSLRLRRQTSVERQGAEDRLRFPQSIVNLANYRSCLVSCFRLHCPIESSLAGFPDWRAIGIELSERLQTPRLAKDLRALGVDPARCPPASAEYAPPMPDFAHALGVFYVLEDSATGGRSILRRLRESLGDCIEGAGAFFDGHGAQSSVMWSAARLAIDAYGAMHPGRCDAVREGADSALRCVGEWMLREKPSAAISRQASTQSLSS